VFRVVDGKVARVKIDVGQRRDGKVEIVRGLAAGDLVVTSGQLKIRDGSAVKFAGADDGKAADGAAGPLAPAKADSASAAAPKS